METTLKEIQQQGRTGREETTGELLLKPEQERLRAMEGTVFALHEVLTQLHIPYRIIGSTALAIYQKQEGQEIKTQPDDIDIALRTHRDLEKIIKYVNNVSQNNMRIENPHRIGERALMAKGVFIIGNHEIPFEFMADTEIVPNETWSKNNKIHGISVISPQDLKMQYGNVAHIEDNSTRHAQRILKSIQEQLAKILIPSAEDTARTILQFFPENKEELQAKLGTALIQENDDQAIEIILALMGRKAKDRSENLNVLGVPQ